MEGQFAPDQLENINPTVIPDFTTTRTAEDILTTTDTAEGVLAGIGAGFVFVWLVLFVLTLAAMWKVFTKAGKPGWAALFLFTTRTFCCKLSGVRGGGCF